MYVMRGIVADERRSINPRVLRAVCHTGSQPRHYFYNCTQRTQGISP